jgi:NAD-dependent DNA ligase
MENIEILSGEIKRNNKLYREGNPEISDMEYDSLVSQLKEADPDNEWFCKPEPVVVSSKRKVMLPIQMKSLSKAKDQSDIERWQKSLSLPGNTEIIIMPKFDGVSLLHDEFKGKAYSRGGAENEGQNCDEHCWMASVASCAGVSHFTYGEFMFSWENWNNHFKGKVSEYTGDPFKSPRNTVAGLINRDEPSPYLRYTSFYRYGIDDFSLSEYETYEEVLEELCITFDQVPMYQKTTIEELCDKYLIIAFNEWGKIFPIDGIIIYINDLNIWKTIGRHQSTGNPLYAIAYKHPDFTETFETVVKSIAWGASKSGALKPVVNIETVNTGDCAMENPTGYNAGWIEDMLIAKGAKILVTRSGGVIPKILKTLVPAVNDELEKLWDDLTECPHCGSPTAWNQSYVELCCTNNDCPGRKLAKIVFFFLTCGAENVGEETFSKIFYAGFTTIKSILNITFDELIQIDGFGESNANIILDNNKKIMAGVEMTTLMHSSDCFEGIGKIKAQKILDEMDDETLCSFYQRWFVTPPLTEEVLKKNTKTMQSFLLGVQPFYKFLTETEIPILRPAKKETNENGICKDMAVCFSGIRDENLENQIIQEGGKIVSGVSKNTALLIVKDKNAASSKISKAKSLNIKIMDMDEFKILLQG